MSRYQSDTMRSTISLISWSVECIRESSDALGDNPLHRLDLGQYSNVPEALDIAKAQLLALIANLRKSNADLRMELKDKDAALKSAISKSAFNPESSSVSSYLQFR